MLTENYDSEAPSRAELEEWANVYGQTFPVLADVDWTVTDRYSARGRPALPTMSLVGPGAELLVAVTQLTEEEVAAAL